MAEAETSKYVAQLAAAMAVHAGAKAAEQVTAAREAAEASLAAEKARSESELAREREAARQTLEAETANARAEAESESDHRRRLEAKLAEMAEASAAMIEGVRANATASHKALTRRVRRTKAKARTRLQKLADGRRAARRAAGRAVADLREAKRQEAAALMLVATAWHSAEEARSTLELSLEQLRREAEKRAAPRASSHRPDTPPKRHHQIRQRRERRPTQARRPRRHDLSALPLGDASASGVHMPMWRPELRLRLKLRDIVVVPPPGAPAF